jgi:hypothetical protein
MDFNSFIDSKHVKVIIPKLPDLSLILNDHLLSNPVVTKFVIKFILVFSILLS